MSDSLFVAAFFDRPGLLSVRFRNQASASPAASFAISRRPDAGPAATVRGCGPLVGVGLAVVLIGFPMLRGCDGGSDRQIPTLSGPLEVDCAESGGWRASLTGLADELAPRNPALRPWAVRTLLDVPRDMVRNGDGTGGWLKPARTDAERAANARGRSLAGLLAGSPGVAVILDLPGPESVAAAAGMAEAFDPVIAIDNLPHPSGVVQAAQTLAAAVYWRPAFLAARNQRPEASPPVFVLEGNRLAPYANEVERFDNRSVARLPDAAGWKALGITRIVYVRSSRGAVAEADDLNQLFVSLAQADIGVQHLALASVDPASRPAGSETDPSGNRVTTWFQRQYGGRGGLAEAPDPDDPDARYHSVLRQTGFLSGIASGTFDGGAREHDRIIGMLATPPPSRSTGGSWSRSHHHSSS